MVNFFKHNFIVSSQMYSENPVETRVILGSMNMMWCIWYSGFQTNFRVDHTQSFGKNTKSPAKNFIDFAIKTY